MTDVVPIRVDIAICTFRRPELTNTLTSLARMTKPQNVHLRIIVADNDVAPSARDHVDAMRDLLAMDLVYVHCPAGNISIARNACLDAADADFLAFVDDDETVEPQWLERLLEKAEQTGADVVLGPVMAVYGSDAPAWMRRGDFHSTRPVWVDGEIRTGYTCNVLLRLSAPALAGRRFDLALGRSGGEDTTFFGEVHAAGGQIVFAGDAWVREPVPASRARFSWLARRRLRMGQTHGQILAGRHDGLARLVAAALAAAKGLFCLATAILLFWMPVPRNRFLLRGLLHAGVLGGLFGAARIEPYGELEASAP